MRKKYKGYNNTVSILLKPPNPPIAHTLSHGDGDTFSDYQRYPGSEAMRSNQIFRLSKSLYVYLTASVEVQLYYRLHHFCGNGSLDFR